MANPPFAGKPATVVAYRVNRRPVAHPTLFADQAAPDILDHFVEMLKPGFPVSTYGKGGERTWRVGGRKVDQEERMVTGRLGWVKADSGTETDWSDEEMDYVDVPGHPETVYFPFVFDADSRILAFVKDPGTALTSVATAFEKILRENDTDPDRLLDWSVEPILDSQDFREWLHDLDVVRWVSFTAKLPNPEPTGAYRDVWERLTRTHGTELTEKFKSDREEGLVNVDQDEDFQQAIGMAEQSFATLKGQGYKTGTKRSYNQTSRVAQETIEEMPYDWDDVWAVLKECVKGKLLRFLEAGDSGGQD